MAAERATRWSNLGLAAAFGGTLLLFVEVVAPFLVPVSLGGFLALLFLPLHERVVLLLGGRRAIASALSCLAVLVLLLLPVLAGAWLMVQQSALVAEKLSAVLGPDGLRILAGGHVPPGIRGPMEESGLLPWVEQGLTGAHAWAERGAGSLVAATTSAALDGFLLVVTLYYLFLDGPRLLVEASRLSPLERRHERELVREFRDTAHAMVVVNLVTSVAQGICGGFAFWLVGLPQPLAFGLLMTVFAFLPVVGTGLVWVPAGFALVLAGDTLSGVFLLAWGLLVIGSIDNVIRPLLARNRMRLHPLMMFVTLFGGLAAFGPVGVLLGPLTGSLISASVRIWRRDFVPRLNEEEPPARVTTLPVPEPAVVPSTLAPREA